MPSVSHRLRSGFKLAGRLNAVFTALAILLVWSTGLSRAEGQQNIHNAVASSDIPSIQPLKQNLEKTGLLHQYTLANGLKVILLPDKAYPYICFSTWYKVGSRDDPPRMTGLTHLVEHLLFQDVGNFQSNQLIDLIVRNGGEFSGFTSEDFTTLYVNLPTSELELAVQGLASCMRSAHFSKTDVQKEIAQLIKESNSEEEDLTSTLNKEVHALAYEQHPYHNPPGGWLQELENLSYDEARVHYDHYFQPNNACLVLAGGFDEQDAVKLIEKYFAPLPKTASMKPGLYQQERPQLAERQIKLKAPGKKESVMVAYKVPGVNDEEAPIFAILEQLFNSQPHGRLHNELIESGLCTNAQAYFELKHDPGLFIIKCSGIPANGSTKVVQALDSLLNRLKKEPLSDTEVSQVLKQTEFTYYSDGDGPYSAVFQTGFFESLDSGEQAFLWPRRLRSITGRKILQAARHYLNDENRVLGEIIAGTNGKSKTTEVDNSSNRSLIAAYGSIHVRLAAYQDSISNYQQASAATSKVVGKDREQKQIATGQISHKVLDNGLNIIVVESHLKPIACVYGSIKAGSAFDRPDCRGQARLMTAIFNSDNFLGNKQQLTSEQNDSVMPSQTMPIFSCHLENITFANRCLSSDIDAQLRHLFAILTQSGVQTADFNGQKNDLINKLRLGETNGEDRIRRAVLSSLITENCSYYPLHPEQEIAALSAVKIGDLQDFYRMHVNPNATTIIVAGDVQPKQVFALLDDVTRNWTIAASGTSKNAAQINTTDISADSAQANAEKEKVPYIPRLIVSNRQAYKSSILLPQESQSQVILGRIIPLPDVQQAQAAWVALHVADCVLSSNPIFSRLTEKFEAKPELLAETDDKLWNTKIIKLANNLIWFMNIRLKLGTSSAAAITAIQKELEEFGQTGLTAQDLAEARRYLAGSIPIRECFNLDKLTRFVFRGYNELNEIDLLTKTKKIMMALRSDDMNQFISHLFKPQDATLVVAGPRQLIKQVHPILQTTEPD